MVYKLIQGRCEDELVQEKLEKIDFFKTIDLAFLDPPFNQDKEYASYYDNLDPDVYWAWITDVIKKIFDLTSEGGAIYFMQREKNAEFVLRSLRETGWTLQNLIVWEKQTSAVPIRYGFGKSYQIIAYATRGKPRVFNRLRYEPSLLAIHEYQRPDGILVTDVWDDIKELTSGYYAGDEAIRTKNGEFFTKDGDRFHKQQSPIQLLTRIILASSQVDDLVLDPFAGTGVTGVVAEQLHRNSLLIEIDPDNCRLISERIVHPRPADNILKFYSDYIFTKLGDSNDPAFLAPIQALKKELQELQKQIDAPPENPAELPSLQSKLTNLKLELTHLENQRILDQIWFGHEKPVKIPLDSLKREPKFNPSLAYLLRETILLILINDLEIPKALIQQDFKLSGPHGTSRFDLEIGTPDLSLIIKLIYARDVKEARFWISQIPFEANLISTSHKNALYLAVLSGSAFLKFIPKLAEKSTGTFHLASFPGWEPALNLPSLKSKLLDLPDLLSRLKTLNTPSKKGAVTGKLEKFL